MCLSSWRSTSAQPDVDPERIKQELTQYGLVSEEWGGDTMFINVSALTGMGVESLVEALALQAEVLELKADENLRMGTLSSAVEKGRGTYTRSWYKVPKEGDFIVSGNHYGRVRSMTGDTGGVLQVHRPCGGHWTRRHAVRG